MTSQHILRNSNLLVHSILHNEIDKGSCSLKLNHLILEIKLAIDHDIINLPSTPASDNDCVIFEKSSAEIASDLNLVVFEVV